ncbi:hypothetical protein BC941DRAFT_435051 [Chlamydoabsidia padenii]|nr:hypothetical protein BC941DRAFT_435051 [Chlamydoabsidia padenii]
MALVQQHYSLPNTSLGKTPNTLSPTSASIQSPKPGLGSTATHPPSSSTNTKALRHWQSQPSLRSKASIQLNQIHVQAQIPHHSTTIQPNKKTLPLTTTLLVRSDLNRTQHKMMLQRQSFLADDKHHLDHPTNMKRLTKEMDRINREYRCVRHYEDPMVESFLRVTLPQPTLNNLSSSGSSFTSTLSSEVVTPPLLQRRASDFMLLQQRRNSNISVHSAILERTHPVPSCHFLTRWFKPSLPPTKRRHSHFTC